MAGGESGGAEGTGWKHQAALAGAGHSYSSELGGLEAGLALPAPITSVFLLWFSVREGLREAFPGT